MAGSIASFPMSSLGKERRCEILELLGNIYTKIKDLEGYVRQDRATAHIKDAHRLYVALTRPRWDIFVFRQQAFLERSLKQSKGKVTNSIKLMINDARDHKLIYG